MRWWTKVGGGLALGALSLGAVACQPYQPDLSCRGDRDCLDSEICHPDERVCVQLCTINADCIVRVDLGKVCAPLSDTNSTRICQCPAEGCKQIPPS